MRDADAVIRAVQAEIEAAEDLRLHVARLGSLNRRGLIDEGLAGTIVAQIPEVLAGVQSREQLKLPEAALATVREQAGLLFAAARRLGEDLAAASLRLPAPHLGARGVQRYGGCLKKPATGRQARQARRHEPSGLHGADR